MKTTAAAYFLFISMCSGLAAKTIYSEHASYGYYSGEEIGSGIVAAGSGIGESIEEAGKSIGYGLGAGVSLAGLFIGMGLLFGRSCSRSPVAVDQNPHGNSNINPEAEARRP